jgi:PAS domain S-box-containing protein
MSAKRKSATVAKRPAPAPTPLRRAAEKAVKARGPAPAPAKPDPARLLHELQVHKVELEMQNENLRHANEELALLNARYQDLYEFAPVAYLTVDVNRRITELNLAAARLVGRERHELPGRKLVDFVHPTSHAVLAMLLSRALVEDGQVEEALVLAPRNGESAYVKAQARRFQPTDAHDPVARVVMMDLTALKSANDELAHALDKFFRYWRP